MDIELQTVQTPSTDAPPAAAAETATSSSPACVSCGERLTGEYCHMCGEKRVAHDDMSLKNFVGDAVQQLVDIEHSKIFKTLTSLIFRPGFLTNEFIAGRRKAYLNPLKMCLIIFGISLFMYTIYRPVAVYDVNTMMESDDTGSWRKAVTELSHEKKIPAEEFIDRVNEKWQHYVSVFQITNVLFLAVMLQIVYIFTQRFFVEHLVFSLHFLSFSFISSLILWPVYLVVGVKPTTASLTMTLIMTFVGIIYLFFALRAVYKQSTAMTLLKTVILYVGSYLILLTIMIGTLLMAGIHVMLT